MAKVKGCDLSQIGRFGKILDFYYWKGILCCRKYPKKSVQPGTPEQKNTWTALRYANAEFNRLAQPERAAFKFLATPSQMSGRDLFLKMILEEYQRRSSNLCRMEFRTEADPAGSVRVVFTKTTNAPVLLAGLTFKDKERYLVWCEISPTLRGKKLLRRWELSDHSENAAAAYFVPKESDRFEFEVFPESNIRYLTARAVLESGGGYGRAGLYPII